MTCYPRKLCSQSPFQKYICDSCASLTVKIYKHSQSSLSCAPNPKAILKRKFNFTPIKGPKRKCLELSHRIKHFPPISSTPVKAKPKYIKKTSETFNLRKHCFKETVIGKIKESRYYHALQLLIKKSKCARNAFIKVLKKSVTKEVKNTVIPSFQIPTSISSLSTFKWETALQELHTRMPILTSVLQSAMPLKNNKSAYMYVSINA